MRKYKILYLTVLFILALCLPKAVSARPFWYGSIVRVEGDTAYIEWKDLETKHYFSCSVTTHACEDIAVVPPAPATGPSVAAQNTQVTFPKKTSYQRLSPTGRYGAYISFDKSSSLRTVGLIDGKTKGRYAVNNTLTFWDSLQEQPHIFRFAPDESTLAYVDDRSGFLSLYVASLSSPSSKALRGTAITSGITIGDFLYTDPETLLYVANTAENPYNWILYSYNIKLKTKKILAENVAYDTVLRPSGSAVLFTQMTPLGTAPVVINDLATGIVSPFDVPMKTPLYNDATFYIHQKLGGVETVFMRSSLKAPPQAGETPSPLIVWLHGGPYRQTSFIRHPYSSYGVYDWMLEEAVGAGAEVLKIDYAGSYGGSRAHTEAIRRGVGKNDMTDVANAISALKKGRSVGDIYLVGNSYGGYLALRSLAGYPELFAGALSINGVTDWAALNTYLQNSIFNTLFGGVPGGHNASLYEKASIISRLKRVTAKKIFIIQAEKDTTVPPIQATFLQEKMKANKVPGTFIIIPGENHVFAKNQSMDTICQTLFTMVGLDADNKCALERQQ